MLIVFYRRNDGTIRYWHDVRNMTKEELLPKISEYNEKNEKEQAYLAEYESKSFEAHLVRLLVRKQQLDLETLRDLSQTLCEADSLVCDLISQAEAKNRGEED